MMKRDLTISVALLVALLAGWVWGGSGRPDLNRALGIAELRDGLLEGVGEGRVKDKETVNTARHPPFLSIRRFQRVQGGSHV